jgi:hypothetical protein
LLCGPLKRLRYYGMYILFPLCLFITLYGWDCLVFVGALAAATTAQQR